MAYDLFLAIVVQLHVLAGQVVGGGGGGGGGGEALARVVIFFEKSFVIFF